MTSSKAGAARRAVWRARPAGHTQAEVVADGGSASITSSASTQLARLSRRRSSMKALCGRSPASDQDVAPLVRRWFASGRAPTPRGLHEIVAALASNSEKARIARKPRDGAQQLLAEAVSASTHGGIRRGGEVFRPLPAARNRDAARRNSRMTPPSQAAALRRSSPSLVGRFRAALGMFTTGVTIDHRARRGTARWWSLTANSFNSVSMEPPLVLWSLARRAGSMPPLSAPARTTRSTSSPPTSARWPALRQQGRRPTLRRRHRGGRHRPALGRAGGGDLRRGSVVSFEVLQPQPLRRALLHRRRARHLPSGLGGLGGDALGKRRHPRRSMRNWAWTATADPQIFHGWALEDHPYVTGSVCPELPDTLVSAGRAAACSQQAGHQGGSRRCAASCRHTTGRLAPSGGCPAVYSPKALGVANFRATRVPTHCGSLRSDSGDRSVDACVARAAGEPLALRSGLDGAG